MVTYGMASRPKSETAATRNPDRTRARILAAALAEFAARGFAGARVDAIARRASVNKRMLYHYFGNKEDLFRAVLHQKIGEHRNRGAALPGDPTERLPFWFRMNCADVDWIRLLQWEALQSPGRKVIDERPRRESALEWLGRLRERQANGEVSADFDPAHLALAMQSLTMYPVAFPQLTRLITGYSADDPEFQKNHAAFLKKFAEAFRSVKSRRAAVQ